MKQEIKNTPVINEDFHLHNAIGQEVANLLNLKFNKDGRTPTSWGNKTFQGLGASIARIVEEQIEKNKK